jgi:RHS repeat-associated protein
VWYVSADAFYNNGATSGSLAGTPFYDSSVPICQNNSEAPLYGTSYGSGQAVTHTTSCGAADPVNCASGNFSHSFTDVSIAGRGPGIDLTRTYNSLNPTSGGLFGNGWSSTYDQSLNTDSPTRAGDGSIVINLDDGSQITAAPNGTGYSTPAATDTTFVANPDGTYTLTRHQTLLETFSAAGQLLSIGDLNGYKTTLTYDASGQLSAITDASGRTVTVTVGANGLVSSITDPLGRTTTYAYDANNNLLSTTDPLGSTWKFTYDSNNRMLTMTDPSGGVVTNTYQSDGRVTEQVDAASLATTFSYAGDNFSSLGGTTTITDPHGSVSVEQYANGFLTQATQGYGTAAQATWTYQYDPNTYGRTQITDPNGNVTLNTYDSDGRVLTTTDATGATTTYTYNALEELTSTQTPLNETSHETYDPDGNLLTATDALGHTTTYAYTDGYPGDVTSVSDPDGRVTSFGYDGDGDVVSKSVSPSSGVSDTTMYVFDVDGEQVCEASADATAIGVVCPAVGSARVADTTSTVFDADGEASSVTDPDGHTTSYQYDRDGNRVQVTAPSGNVTTTVYDADSRVVSTTAGANGSAPSTTTDAYDLVPGSGACQAISGATYCTSTTNPNGGVTVDYFNARDELIEETLPDGQATEYGYDAAGNKTGETNAAGQVTSYGYDADDRVTSISYSDGVTPDVSYAYDNDGHRTSMVDGTGTTSYGYDSDGRLTSVSNGAGATVAYAYDGEGDATSLTYPNGETVTRVYDGADRLVSVTDWNGQTTSFAYDPDGNLISTSYPNGDTVNSSYDSTDALMATSVGSMTAPLAGIAYVRNPDGLITQESDSAALTGTTTYTYSAQDQLTSASANTYQYDPGGDLITKGSTTQAFNSADQLTSSITGAVTIAYDYDPIGDLTSVTDLSGTATDYSYDQIGQLLSVTQLAPQPGVSEITPAAGPISGGTAVTITGSGFTDATAVAFGTVAATSFNVVSNDEIKAVAPAQTAGPVDITVTTSGGTSATVSADQYTYVTAPTVSKVNPASGSISGGTSVTITGSGFTGATAVKFGTVAATSFTVGSATAITATAPAQSAGVHAVYVTTPGGTSASVQADRFTYVGVPTVTAITPATGSTKGGTSVTITGSGFTGATSVTFGTVSAASFKVKSMTEVTAVAPAETAGPVNITVITPSGGSATVTGDQFTYVSAPTISQISPQSGSTAGGTTVAITGSGFTGATAVTFGTVAATGYTIVSGTEITASSPAEAAGAKAISVTTPAGKSASVTADKFSYLAPPTLTKVAPTSGSAAGGTSVTVTGSGFSAATAVTFGSVAASSYKIVSNTKITAVSPAQADGTVNISVTTPAGTTPAVSADDFAYTGSAASARARQMDQMAEASADSQAPTSTTVAAYTYNGDGLRMSETTGTGTLSFVWDTTTSVPEMLTDGSNFYIYGPGGLPIEQIASGGNTSYFFHDNNGSTRALLTSSGSIGATFTYRAWGSLASETGTLTTPLMWGQGYTDTATGLLYLVNRYYDPATAQFTSVDPDLSTTGQPYEYAGDDSVNQGDPDGLYCFTGENANGSCRGSSELLSAGEAFDESGIGELAGKTAGKVLGIAEDVYTGGEDAVSLAETCGQSWISTACGAAIQKAGVDVAVGLVSSLCAGTVILIASCSAAVSGAGQWLLNTYGIKISSTGAEVSSQGSLGDGSSRASVTTEPQSAC